MTNYNERIDKVLDKFGNGVIEAYLIAPKSRATADLSLESSLNEAQAAITSLTKELVVEANPLRPQDDTMIMGQASYADGIRKYEQNLLKALEEV